MNSKEDRDPETGPAVAFGAREGVRPGTGAELFPQAPDGINTRRKSAAALNNIFTIKCQRRWSRHRYPSNFLVYLERVRAAC